LSKYPQTGEKCGGQKERKGAEEREGGEKKRAISPSPYLDEVYARLWKGKGKEKEKE